jgi:hypothetical protein
MEYNVNGQITFDDYLQCNKTLNRYKGFIWLTILFIIILIIFSNAVSFLSALEALSDLCFAFGIIGIIFNLMKRWLYKSEYNASELSKHIQKIKIDEERISIEIGSFNTFIKRESLKTSVFRDLPLKNARFAAQRARNCKGTSKNNRFLEVPKSFNLKKIIKGNL